MYEISGYHCPLLAFTIVLSGWRLLPFHTNLLLPFSLCKHSTLRTWGFRIFGSHLPGGVMKHNTHATAHFFLFTITTFRNCVHMSQLSKHSFKKRDYFYKRLHGLGLMTPYDWLHSVTVTNLIRFYTGKFSPYRSFGIRKCDSSWNIWIHK